MALVTQLQDSINDTALNILGAARIEFKRVDEPTRQTQGLTLLGVEPFTCKVFGGHFTDDTLAADLGDEISLGTNQSTIYVSNDDCIVFVRFKYTVRRILMVSSSGNNKIVDLGTLGYMGGLEQLDTSNAILKGSFRDFAASGSLENITTLVLTNGRIDISLGDLSFKTSWSTTIPNRFVFDGNNVTGDVSVFNGIDIDRISVKNPTGAGISGDLSLVNAKFITTISNPNKFSWTPGVRPSSYNLTVYEGVDFGDDVDAMFNDIQNCNFVPSSSASFHSTINVRGKRTSASDAAVEAIKAKGLVVKVNGITL